MASMANTPAAWVDTLPSNQRSIRGPRQHIPKTPRRDPVDDTVAHLNVAQPRRQFAQKFVSAPRRNEPHQILNFGHLSVSQRELRHKAAFVETGLKLGRPDERTGWRRSMRSSTGCVEQVLHAFAGIEHACFHRAYRSPNDLGDLVY